jgi:hypothetical protein
MSPDAFISRWSAASANERSNSQSFLSELADLLQVERPHNHFDHGYAFEFTVTEHHHDGTTSARRIDLYKRGCFVLESKQFQTAQPDPTALEQAAAAAAAIHQRRRTAPIRGTDQWDDAMTRARGQAERYIRALPASEPNPPFLIVVDVGASIELYADFTQAGKAYLPFPDPRRFRIRLADLKDESIRERLRLVWTDPLSLDPARKSAEVTRDIAAYLAELAKSYESAGHPPQVVADFLSRCLFCMFAEDVGLLPKDSFKNLLGQVNDDGSGFQPLLGQLFREMNTGTDFSTVLRKKLLQFNGGLFADDTVLPVNKHQLSLLRSASGLNWRNVEPAIFGTLLERALNPHDRHKLGAHYTPRAYVERLVLPTVIEPLRAEWESVRTAALTHARLGKVDKAIKEIRDWHHKLCQVKVLDPACGSGNFLYVTLEHMKRLEGEVLLELEKYGDRELTFEMQHFSVDPHQFLGIEVNPRAASITELVLWIGYLQWHFRTRGQTMPAEPIIKKFKNIECRDAVLAWDGDPQPVTRGMALENPDLPGLPDQLRKEVLRFLKNCEGRPGVQFELVWENPNEIVTVWDRRSYKKDLVTGREIPDESKRIPLLTYKNPRPAEWPQADYIVGNPPFLGKSKLREATGDGYAETLRKAYPDVPESTDFVMYWWQKAALNVRSGHSRRFGLITTNSLRQTFNRRVIEDHMSAKPPIHVVFAIGDHPWVESADGAAVRIAMTVGALSPQSGELFEVKSEEEQDDGSANVAFEERTGVILPDLTLGANIPSMVPLQSNEGLTSNGVMLGGRGFLVSDGLQGPGAIVRPIMNGNDVLQTPRSFRVIDFYGMTVEQARSAAPDAYQQLLTRVKPERDANRRAARRERWWLFSEVMPQMRRMLNGLRRYVATPETAKHRIFVFLNTHIVAEHPLIALALDDAYNLGVLSSRVHVAYSLASGGTLEDRPRYNKSRCFDPFPFPDCTEPQRDRIRKIAEELDAHRKRVQAQHPGLTLTGMYNVLEKLRANQPLTTKEKLIHDQALVSTLKQLHDDLDAAVFDAYHWPRTLTDAEILERLVALNAERAREEAAGQIRWLRPDYQIPLVQKSIPGGTRSPSPTSTSRDATESTATATRAKDSTRKKASQEKPDETPATPNSKLKTKNSKLPKRPWPKSLPDRAKAIESILHSTSVPMTPADIARHFRKPRYDHLPEIQEILETLCTFGRARPGKEKGTYTK